MERFCLVRFSRKTGKIDTSMYGYSSALMQMWALNNGKKSKDMILFSLEDGKIKKYYEGVQATGSSWPKEVPVTHDNIRDYCPGMLEAVRAEWEAEHQYE